MIRGLLNLKVDPAVEIGREVIKHRKTVEADGTKYHFMPFWMQEKDGKLTMLSLEKLPQELKDTINKMRHSSEGSIRY